MSMYTIDDIRKMQPCYDPSRYLPEDWRGDAITILDDPYIPELDKIWVVRNWLPERTLRLFAVWCARRALSLVADPDPRSVAACDVAEKFANGEASKADLQTAREAAAAAIAANGANAANAANATTPPPSPPLALIAIIWLIPYSRRMISYPKRLTNSAASFCDA